MAPSLLIVSALSLLNFLSLCLIHAMFPPPASGISNCRLSPSLPNKGSSSGELLRFPRFAYFIAGNKGDDSQVRHLLQAVYHPRNYYLIHLDLEMPKSVRVELVKLEGVVSEIFIEEDETAKSLTNQTPK